MAKKNYLEKPFSCTRDGLTIRGLLFEPAAGKVNTEGKLPVAIVSHMFMVNYKMVVKYARFLGIKDKKIVRYVFRNAMLPQVTGLAMSIGSMVGGALVAETIFSYPGLGMKMYAAIGENDYNTVSGIALISLVSLAAVVIRKRED